ncbi:TIGR02530 family flagellar biosynthesis protein [Saccharibacillus sp. CPCC 101409]|uniref:TIGR02530 family flagellar biosynthesis protein n=1 Tax=Saccharibacillus sp. CPCC 101409 TaxID=3058041 RepID=UPI0026713022|nr:TIGR02530 family flagellar biosynthesis protein [Saccharibacillus sp. CPCC 101409]MDO3410696.1 TIGR02530 family flagellar biosynthesis protein [Saccharibacillus sp. CPCC 101409]
MSEPIRIGQLYPAKLPPAAARNTSSNVTTTDSFQSVLEDKLLKFSGHASKRLEQRGIQLNTDQLRKIGSAIDKAAAKGSKESLVLMQDMALIVNVRNRTVVTAMDGSSMKDNVFTQIDSAVIVS